MGWKAVKDHYGLKGLIAHCRGGILYVSQIGSELDEDHHERVANAKTGELLPTGSRTSMAQRKRQRYFARDQALFARLVTQEDVFNEPTVTLYEAAEGGVIKSKQAIMMPEGLMLVDGTRFDPYRHFQSLVDASAVAVGDARMQAQDLEATAQALLRQAQEMRSQADKAHELVHTLEQANKQRERAAIICAMRAGKEKPPEWEASTAAQRRNRLGAIVAYCEHPRHAAAGMSVPADWVRWQLEDYLAMPGAIQPSNKSTPGPADTAERRLGVLQLMLATQNRIEVEWVRRLLVEYGMLDAGQKPAKFRR